MKAVARVRRTWIVNGEERKVSVAPMRRLLDILRADLGLYGAKEGCGEGECGACTVLINGEPRVACLTVAAQIPDGTEILTIEGLADTVEGRVLQEAFVSGGAVQCGFCIPGMLMAAYALLLNNSEPSEEDVRRALAGNLCRCTGYVNIVKAVLAAARRLNEIHRAESQGEQA